MKKLIFVTSKFPYGNGETFIENEINYLAKAFDKVFIYATEANSSEHCRAVPENVTAFAANPRKVSKLDYLPCLIKPTVIKEIFSNCLSGNVPGKISACCYFWACVNASLQQVCEFLKVCDVTTEDEVVIYSYWLHTIGMTALHIKNRLKKYVKTMKCVSRCHGFDVYVGRSHAKYQPFQEYEIKSFDGVYPCAKAGEQYLKERYPSLKDKISAKYLGVEDHFKFVFPKKDDVFSIVSCSNVIPVKRVHRIAEALSQITDKEILWTHFGDGEEFEALNRLCAEILPKNVQYALPGRIPNEQIYDFYNNHNVNLFINVSSSEGLPVSIMEAISFGIPMIATDVGGTNEIVTDGKNGCLLPEDFKTADLADLIIKFINFPDEEYHNFCKNARETFESSFVAKKAYTVI